MSEQRLLSRKTSHERIVFNLWPRPEILELLTDALLRQFRGIPATETKILKTDKRLDSRQMEAHSEFEHAPKPRPFKLRPLK